MVNAVLAAFKMAAGILGGSSALISDAVDSACDVFSSLIVMIGVKFASKSPDEDHPYGHERFECISSIVLALIIGATGLGVGWSAVGKILSGGDLQAPAAIALVAAGSVVGWGWSSTRLPPGCPGRATCSGLSGSRRAWLEPNLGVLVALLIGVLGHLALGRGRVARQEARS